MMKNLSTPILYLLVAGMALFTTNRSYAQDIGIAQSLYPVPYGIVNSNSQLTVSFVIKNYGGVGVAASAYGYAIDGGVVSFDTLFTLLNPGDSGIVSSINLSITPGIHTLCIFSQLTGDINSSNDTICINFTAIAMLPVPYQTDFEGSQPAAWINNIPSSGPAQWEWGTPAYGVTNSAHSGVSAFDLDLDSAYAAGSDNLMVGPFDFSQTQNPQISFWQNRDLSPVTDGLRLDYSLDSGLTWTVAGSVGAFNSENWYNKNVITSSSQPGWDSSSNGWQHCSVLVPALAGLASNPVYFRFVYDGIGSSFAGVSIDDFKILPNPLAISLSITSILCFGDSGSLGAGATGGIPPYTFQWSNGATTSSISGLAAGSYTVTVTDAFLDSVSVGFTLTQPSPLTVSNIISPAVCGQANGCITLAPVGGVQPYNYQWAAFPLNLTNIQCNLAPGSYIIYITDMNGCVYTDTAVVTVFPPPTLSQTSITQPSSCSACDGAINISVFGISPFLYAWSNGVTTQNVTNLCTGPYNCIVTDANGCTAFISGTIQTSSFTAQATSTPTGCGQSTGTATVTVTGGVQPYTYLWSTGSVSQTSTTLSIGNYTVSVTDANGCYAYSTVLVDDSCHGVWPGDANYDLVADNNDLLNIGIAFGATGAVRPAASLNWVAQPCPAWGTAFVSGADYKNADCNGDGIVGNADTLAIVQNYGLNHPLKPNPFVQALPGQPDLYLVVSNDTTGLSDTVSIDVLLGNPGNPVDSIYGLAFTLSTDAGLVDSAYASVDFSNSWIGTPGIDMLTLYKNRLNEGAIDVALVRTDHVNVSGNGSIARAVVVTTDNIAGKGLSLPSATMTFILSNLHAITAGEYELLYNLSSASVVIDSSYISGVPWLNPENLFSIHPNPSQGMFVISGIKQQQESIISVTDIFGNSIYKGTMDNGLHKLNLSGNNSGVYFLRIKSGNSVINKKLVITR